MGEAVPKRVVRAVLAVDEADAVCLGGLALVFGGTLQQRTCRDMRQRHAREAFAERLVVFRVGVVDIGRRGDGAVAEEEAVTERPVILSVCHAGCVVTERARFAGKGESSDGGIILRSIMTVSMFLNGGRKVKRRRTSSSSPLANVDASSEPKEKARRSGRACRAPYAVSELSGRG